MGVLSGKVAIVTGATSGIGKGCAIEMAKAGAKIIVTGRNEERGANTVRLVHEVGGEVTFVRQDVTVEKDWAHVMDVTLSTYGRLDCLLNNAGEAVIKPLEKLTLDDLQFLLRVDLDGPFLGVKHAWPHLKKSGGGTILNMSSITGQKGGHLGSAYCAAKGAQLSTACQACHAADGTRGSPANPILQGQHPEYLVKQLVEFKSGKRKNAVMSGRAAALSEDDMKHIAAFYASKKAKAGFAKSKDTVLLGEQIWRGGIVAKQVPACAGCHSPSGAGIPAQYPRIGGQHADYTTAQLQSFSVNQRGNSAQMMAIAAKMNEREMKAVADYAAGLR